MTWKRLQWWDFLNIITVSNMFVPNTTAIPTYDQVVERKCRYLFSTQFRSGHCLFPPQEINRMYFDMVIALVMPYGITHAQQSHNRLNYFCEVKRRLFGIVLLTPHTCPFHSFQNYGAIFETVLVPGSIIVLHLLHYILNFRLSSTKRC